jgi:hypothetical protein
MSKATTTIDTLAVFKSSACAIYSGIAALAIIGQQVATLREAGIKFGKSKKSCQYRVQFSDAMKAVFQGKAEKTYANYVTSFVSAVNDGTEFSYSHSKGKAKGSKKGKGAELSSTEKMASALLNVWKLSDVADDLLIMIETNMARGLTLIEAIEDVLRFCGQELAE